jgi:MarC family integral membrane protein
MRLVKIFDDRQRLEQDRSVAVDQSGKRHHRVDCAARRLAPRAPRCGRARKPYRPASLIGTALLGDLLLRMLGISLPAFRIAGGLLLFAIAFEMVLGVRMRREGQAAEEAIEEHVRNVAGFTLAIPLMAGPGAITATVLLAGRAYGNLRIRAVRRVKEMIAKAHARDLLTTPYVSSRRKPRRWRVPVPTFWSAISAPPVR